MTQHIASHSQSSVLNIFFGHRFSQKKSPSLACVSPFIITALLAGFGTHTAIANDSATEEQAKPLPPVEFRGYWRLGYNTDINPLQANQSDQSTSFPTSRHIHEPSYFRLELGKSFENGARVYSAVDHSGSTPHKDGDWNPKTPEGLANRDFRIRDLYLEVPAGKATIWAGARRLEWEDIRILDYGNPFNVNGYGIGAKYEGTTAALTVTDRKTSYVVGTGATATTPELPLKDVNALVRHELAIGEKRSLKPMLQVTQYGSAPENDNVGQPEIKGATSFKIGGIYSSWSDAHWANMGLWFESNPVDNSGSKSGTDTSLGLLTSNSYEFGEFGVLTGILVKYDSFKDSRPEYKVTDDKKSLVADGDKKTNNRVSASLALQPVYYATENIHLALDLNYAMNSKKFATATTLNAGTPTETVQIASNDSNAYFVTPIIRYAMSKNTLGSPQIYTSVTYGKYDWKLKKNSKGEATDALLTTQTGFEVWF